MRIISGYCKGKKIYLPKDKKTRPLRDIVKESIFNILNHSNNLSFRIEDSEVLDLFSGSGSFGLECISRGAKKVFFGENYAEAIKILKKNINFLNCEDKSLLIELDCFEIDNFLKKSNQKFDLIFLDPPFKEKKVNLLLLKILDLKILKKNGIIIIHRENVKSDQFTEKFKILESRSYGISKIIFGN